MAYSFLVLLSFRQNMTFLELSVKASLMCRDIKKEGLSIPIGTPWHLGDYGHKQFPQAVCITLVHAHEQRSWNIDLADHWNNLVPLMLELDPNASVNDLPVPYQKYFQQHKINSLSPFCEMLTNVVEASWGNGHTTTVLEHGSASFPPLLVIN